MNRQTAFTLVNKQNGNLAFKIFDFEGSGYFDHVQRNNYYTIVFVQKGTGTVKADFSEYELKEHSVFCFSPYQPFMFVSQDDLKGTVVQFHPDFFCIHKHHNQVACNGVLFNNIYQPPFVLVDAKQEIQLSNVIEQIKDEMHNPVLAQYELLVSQLKILLIYLSRIKTEQSPEAAADIADDNEPFILQNLKEAIENHFRTKHSSGEYANLLHISPKALAKITKTHFNKTLTDLIAERIIIEAKRELYLTSKPIKQIASELGYEDEYYFSRFFKTNVEVSPQLYRKTVGFAAAER